MFMNLVQWIARDRRGSSHRGEVHNEVYLGEEEMCTVLLYDTTIFVQKYRVSVWHAMNHTNVNRWCEIHC